VAPRRLEGAWEEGDASGTLRIELPEDAEAGAVIGDEDSA
jgi:hypothetical protein